LKVFPRAEPPARKNKEVAFENRALGNQVDHIFNVDQEIDELEAKLRALKQRREKLAAKCLAAMNKQQTDGCKGLLALANVKTTRHPSIKNRAKFDVWVMKHNMMHLLQNRVSSKAYFELVEDGVKVPGVEVFEKVSLSIIKRRK